MGLFANIATILANYEEGRVESTEAYNQGIREMFARGGAPDTIRAEQAAYTAEVDAAVYAEVGGVTVDLASPEYAAWYATYYG